MEWLRERPIAHRGLHSESVPENSLPAFENAVSAGYPAELDVRLTADGVPVVVHDRRLDRLTDGSGTVGNTNWRDLSERTLLDTDETVPRLETVLETVDGDVPLLVEVKNARIPGDLESAVATCLDAYDGKFAVQSFNPLTVWWFRRNRPDWLRGQLASVSMGSGPLSHTALRRVVPNLTSPDFVGYNYELLPQSTWSRIRHRGSHTLAWTVSSEAVLRRVEPHVDNVIFESVRP